MMSTNKLINWVCKIKSDEVSFICPKISLYQILTTSIIDILSFVYRSMDKENEMYGSNWTKSGSHDRRRGKHNLHENILISFYLNI